MVFLNDTSPQRRALGELGQGLFDILTALQNQTRPDVSRRVYRIGLLLILVMAAAVQLGFFLGGLYTLSADESARALLAHKLTLGTAFVPFIWPPLGAIINSLALHLYDDVFITPRVLVFAAGLGAVAGVAFLTKELFTNRLVALIAAALSILLPHRLLLSIVPLSDIFGSVLLLFAAGYLAAWLKGNKSSDLIVTCVLFFFAGMSRYEIWLFNAVLALYLAHRTLIRRDLKIGIFILCGAVLSAFPIFWIARIRLEFGNLDLLSMTSRQFIEVFGRNYVVALEHNVFVDLLEDVLLSPVLVLGAALMTYFVWRVPMLRAWVMLLFVPLAILAVQMAVSLGVPMAAPFRIDGTWVLFLLPFAAFGLVYIAEKVSSSQPRQYAVLALVTYMAIVPLGLRAHAIAKGSQVVPVTLNGDDLALGRYLRKVTDRDGSEVLLNSTASLDFMNIPVAANRPDRFVLDVDADPPTVGIYTDSRAVYAAKADHTVYNRYLADKFGLAGTLDMQKLESRNIGHLVVQDTADVGALDANPSVRREAEFGHWVVYAVNRQVSSMRAGIGALHPADQGHDR